MPRDKSGGEVSIGDMTKADRDAGNLNGMPGSEDIEKIVLLREAAREKLATLKPGSPQAMAILEALSEMEDANFSADQEDVAQCGARAFIRSGGTSGKRGKKH